MIVEKINLYEYFGIKKSGAAGELTAIVRDKPICGGTRPAALILAGGGYDHVSAREREPAAMKFSADGFDVFTLEYTCRTPFPASAFEAALAMLYIRANAEKYCVKADKVACVGFSAGAHLAGTLGIIPNDGLLTAKLRESPAVERLWKKFGVRPDALVLCYPVISGEEGVAHKGSFDVLTNGDNRLIEALSLEKHVTGECPPLVMWHTSDDGTVPVKNSLKLASAYAEAGLRFSLHVFACGRHGLSTADRESYAESDVPHISAGVVGWEKFCLDFLHDNGFLL